MLFFQDLHCLVYDPCLGKLPTIDPPAEGLDLSSFFAGRLLEQRQAMLQEPHQPLLYGGRKSVLSLPDAPTDIADRLSPQGRASRGKEMYKKRIIDFDCGVRVEPD